MIDILIPVRGRPQNAAVVANSIHDNTVNPHTILFLATPGDDEQIEACKKTGSIVWLVDGDDYQYARKINTGAGVMPSNTPSAFVFLGADDLRFHPGWDTHAVRVYEERGLPVIGTNDLGNPTVIRGKHATHSLVHRSYIAQGTIDEPGKLLHEGYHHNYCDTEFWGTAQKRGAVAFSFDSHVEHLHPFWHKGTDDPIYELGRAGFREDARLYNTRRKLWR